MKVALDIAQQMTLILTSDFRLQRDEPVEVKRHIVNITRSLWVNDHDWMSVRAMFDSILDFCKNASIKTVITIVVSNAVFYTLSQIWEHRSKNKGFISVMLPQDSQKCGVSSNKGKERRDSIVVQLDNDVVFDGGAAQVDGVGQTEHQMDVAVSDAQIFDGNDDDYDQHKGNDKKKKVIYNSRLIKLKRRNLEAQAKGDSSKRIQKMCYDGHSYKSCLGLVKRQQKDQSLLGQRQLQEQLMFLFPEG
ncbi:hypothetical protein MIR68_009601 [Amoeboaphelidium protococcarum]|nr:hypothetical protein MIR68_009601 [Amoeboaphelidium protococcarum]